MPRYRSIKVNGKTKLLHRYLMECWLGRELTADEVVHHKNGDRLDNRIENLEVMTHQAHANHHNQRHPITRMCDVCGVEYAPRPSKRATSKTCSRDCFLAIARVRARDRANDPGYRAKLSSAAHRNGSAERARTLVKSTRWRNVPPRPEQVLCACGCGTQLRVSAIPSRQAKWVLGHHLRGKSRAA